MKIVKILLENGADRSLVNEVGKSALNVADECYRQRLSEKRESLRTFLEEYKQIVDLLSLNN